MMYNKRTRRVRISTDLDNFVVALGMAFIIGALAGVFLYAG